MREVGGLERLSLGTIRCVREVLERKSMTLAAEHLGISQPAVSMQVARFENLSGITIISREGNALSVRDDAVASLIGTIVEAEDTLLRIARGENCAKPRLGLCDYMAAHYCKHLDQYLQLAERFEIYIGKPCCLLQMFSRGELDVVNRPLFAHESDTDLVMRVPLAWLSACALKASRGSGSTEPLPVILGTQLSPYTRYAERALKESDVDYRIVAHVDDHLTRSHFVGAGLGVSISPTFLMRGLPAGISPHPGIKPPKSIRFALFHNKKKIQFFKAQALFENIESQIEKSELCRKALADRRYAGNGSSL